MYGVKNKGITLVALVVTIVILLILAGISIASLTNSGLFENAKLAKEKSDEAREKEDGFLSDYENKIAEYVNNDRAQGKSNLNYSLDEQVVGQWINGKPLYQKTVIVNMPSDITDYASKNIKYPLADLNINNYDLIYVSDGIVLLSDGQIFTFNDIWGGSGTNYSFMRAVISKEEAVLGLVSNRNVLSNCKCYITLQYTKTTDEATIDIDD